MSTVQETSTPRDRRIIYAVITGALVLLLIVCLVFYRSAQSNQQAQERPADRRTPKAGVRAVPSQEQIVGVLGDDGGALCKDPASALRKSILFGQLTNGAAGPGVVQSSPTARFSRDSCSPSRSTAPTSYPDSNRWSRSSRRPRSQAASRTWNCESVLPA